MGSLQAENRPGGTVDVPIIRVLRYAYYPGYKTRAIYVLRSMLSVYICIPYRNRERRLSDLLIIRIWKG